MNASVFSTRRAALAQALQSAGGGVAVVPTAPEQLRNNDCDHPYRHDSSFHYLTGFDEPGATLVLDASGRSTLFCRDKDIEREIWDGHRLGPQAAVDALGVSQAFPLHQVDKMLPELLAGQPALWFAFGQPGGLQARTEGWLDAVRAGNTGQTAPVVHLVHGEPAAQDAFAEQLRGAGYQSVSTPLPRSIAIL